MFPAHHVAGVVFAEVPGHRRVGQYRYEGFHVIKISTIHGQMNMGFRPVRKQYYSRSKY